MDGTHYTVWSVRMKLCLRTTGLLLWNSVISGYTPPNKVRTTTQMDVRKNYSMTMNTILDGLEESIKEKIGQCI